jgi:polyhydroxyalkanoate synthesis regulator phasin
MMAMDLRTAADELYSLPPSGFVAARNTRAAAAKADGDRALADEIRRLPKPSASAWAINLLVRQRADEIASALELGESLREAQDDLDRASLTALSAQRRRLVAALAREAGELSEQLGQPVNASAVREVEQTLSAAMADADAARAVRSGRLLRALESLGFEPVDLADAVAVPDEDGAPAVATAGNRRGSTAPTLAPVRNIADERAKRAERARAEAQRAVDDAEQQVEAADAELDDLEERAGALEDKREEHAAELDELQAAIDAVEREVAKLDRDARALERERGRVDRLAQQARRRAEAARERLRRLD